MQHLAKKLRLFDSLAYRLARASVLVAIGVGIILSGLQVYLDYGRQSDALDRQVDEMINVAAKPAARAVFTIDYKLADQIANGLLIYQFVDEVKITGDHGEELGHLVRAERDRNGSALSRAFDEKITLTRVLAPPETEIAGAGSGKLEVTISRGVALEGFFERAVIVFLVGLARNILLTLVLLYVFGVIAARPLKKFVEAFRGINPAKPEASSLKAPSGHENSEIGVLADAGQQFIHEISELIAERRRAEEELARQVEAKEAALKAAMEANEAKTIFLAHMSHEFRTPLNAIIGYSELIANSYEDVGPERVREFVRPIHQAGNILRGHIEDVLTFAQLEKGERTLDVKPMPVRSAMANALRLLRPQFRDKGIQIKVAGRRNAVSVRADERALDQIFINVFENAVKYSPPSSEIDIAISISDEYCTVSIRDRGPGIPEAEIGEVLKPFSRSSDPYVATHPGTGLGLAISSELLLRTGGALSLANAPDGGLAVSISLPRA